MGIICRFCRQLVDSVGTGKTAVEAQGIYHTCADARGTLEQMARTREAADEIVDKHGSMFEERS